MLVSFAEVELLAAEDALIGIEASFNVVLIEVVAFFVDEVVFFVEDVTLLVDEDFFVELVVFFAAATDEDEAEA